MLKYHFSYLAVAIMATALCFNACTENIDSTEARECNGTVVGIITNSLVEASPDNNNQTHASGHCLATELCQLLYNEYNNDTNNSNNQQYACNSYNRDYILCDITAQPVNAFEDGRCGTCTPCQADEVCNKLIGKCEKSDFCDENAKRCSANGNYVEICKNSRWQKETDCYYGCRDNKCAERICTENNTQCSQDKTYLEICHNNRWEKGDDCPDGCNNNKCNPHICDADVVQCAADNNSTEICKDNKWEKLDTCTDGCKNNQCIPHVCDENQHQCSLDRNSLEICRSNQWLKNADCPKGCENSVCHICDENDKRCSADGTASEICKSNTWTTLTLCTEENTACDPENFTCQACIPTDQALTQYGSKFCCSPNDKIYHNLFHQEQCEVGNLPEYQESRNYMSSYSYGYCISPEKISSLDIAATCFVGHDELDHLYDYESCGHFGKYQNCELLNDHGENVRSCSIGRCCYKGISSEASLNGLLIMIDNDNTEEPIYSVPGLDKQMLKGSYCCSGYAYELITDNWKISTYACTDGSEFCVQMCGSNSCECEDPLKCSSCRML